MRALEELRDIDRLLCRINEQLDTTFVKLGWIVVAVETMAEAWNARRGERPSQTRVGVWHIRRAYMTCRKCAPLANQLWIGRANPPASCGRACDRFSAAGCTPGIDWLDWGQLAGAGAPYRALPRQMAEAPGRPSEAGYRGTDVPFISRYTRGGGQA